MKGVELFFFCQKDFDDDEDDDGIHFVVIVRCLVAIQVGGKKRVGEKNIYFSTVSGREVDPPDYSPFILDGSPSSLVMGKRNARQS